MKWTPSFMLGLVVCSLTVPVVRCQDESGGPEIFQLTEDYQDCINDVEASLEVLATQFAQWHAAGELSRAEIDKVLKEEAIERIQECEAKAKEAQRLRDELIAEMTARVMEWKRGVASVSDADRREERRQKIAAYEAEIDRIRKVTKDLDDRLERLYDKWYFLIRVSWPDVIMVLVTRNQQELQLLVDGVKKMVEEMKTKDVGGLRGGLEELGPRGEK